MPLGILRFFIDSHSLCCLVRSLYDIDSCFVVGNQRLVENFQNDRSEMTRLDVKTDLGYPTSFTLNLPGRMTPYPSLSGGAIAPTALFIQLLHASISDVDPALRNAAACGLSYLGE